MTPRDNLGRFTTAQHADALAAERLLERAVAEAVRRLRWYVNQTRGERKPQTFWQVSSTVILPPPRDLRIEAETILRHATESASLLIDRRPAA